MAWHGMASALKTGRLVHRATTGRSMAIPKTLASLTDQITYYPNTLSFPLADFGGHAFYTAAFGAAGYYFYGLEGRQYAAIEAKKEEILRNRERMEQVRAARQEAAGAQEEH